MCRNGVGRTLENHEARGDDEQKAGQHEINMPGEHQQTPSEGGWQGGHHHAQQQRPVNRLGAMQPPF